MRLRGKIGDWIAMGKLYVLIMLLLVTALLVACASMGDPMQTTNAEEIQMYSTTPTVEPIETTCREGNQTEPAESTATEPTNLGWQHEAALTRFLNDTNHNGTIIPFEELVPPGTLPEVWQIPKADQELVGETVSIILAKEQQVICFYYIYTTGGVERLAVFIRDNIPLLMVFETTLGGIDGLCSAIKSETVFQGKILSMTNVCFEEGVIYAKNVCSPYDIPEHEILTENATISVGECLGYVGVVDSAGATEVFIKGGVYETASSSLQKDIDWMKEKFRRFSLESIFPV